MKFRYILLISLGLFLSDYAAAQQLPFMTFYRENWSLLNPATYPIETILNEMSLSAGATYRYQWTGVEGAPQTAIAHFDYLSEENPISFGANILHDQADAIGATAIYGKFTYRLPVGGRGQSFSVGIAAGAVQYRVDINEIEFREANDIAASQGETKFFPDFSFGAFYYHKELWYAGVSVPQTFGLNTTFRADDGEFSIERVRHYYFIAGGFFHFDRGTSYIEPSIWFRYLPNAPTSVNANVRYQFDNPLWVGLGGGLSGIVHGELGIRLLNDGYLGSALRIGVGYDYAITNFGPDFGHTFELSVSYSWGGK